MPRRILVVAAVTAVLAVLLTACTTVSSSGIATSAINPRIYVESRPGGATDVYVALLHGFNEALQLSGWDTLTVSLDGGAATTMTFGSDLVGAPAYVAHLTGVVPGDTVTIALTRSDEADAPNTVVTIPANTVSVTSPTANASLSYSGDVPVAWTPSVGSGRVAARLAVVSCTQYTSTETAALDTLFHTPSLKPQSDGSVDLFFDVGDHSGTCDLEALVGSATGNIALDPAFGTLNGLSASVRLGAPVPFTVQ